MESTTTTSLLCGRVALVSEPYRCSLRIYGPTQNRHGRPTTWSEWDEPGSQAGMSLDRPRELLTDDEKRRLGDAMLRPAREVLDAEYPGGYSTAVAEPTEWLLAEDPRH